jgi:glutamate--cysteine ligase
MHQVRGRPAPAMSPPGRLVTAPDEGTPGTGATPNPGVEDPTRPATVRHESDVHGFITRTCFKIGPPGRVGVEAELFVLDDRSPHGRVPIERLTGLLAGPGPLPSGSTVTFEPGGQVELSTAPGTGPLAAIRLLARDLRATDRRLAPAGLATVATGADPVRRPERILDHPRYASMERFFDAAGECGRAMMTTSAATQVSLDAGAEPDDVRRRWRLANDLAPLLTAMFANSPLHRGAPTGLLSSRQGFWSGIDPGRTRAPDGDDPAQAWARYALAARVMVLRDPDRGWVADPGVTFAEWVAGALGHRPTEDDLAYHLTTLFPPVRPRAWLELRSLDALPAPWWPVAVAVCALLLDDPDTSRVAGAVASDVAGRWSPAARDGMADPVLRAAAEECLAVVSAGLRAGAGASPAELPSARGLADLVDAYRERFTARGRTPADEVLAAFDAGQPGWTAVTAPAAGAPGLPLPDLDLDLGPDLALDPDPSRPEGAPE